MNGVHDMGGMHGMGPIQYESNEPVVHEPWEARVFALNRAVRAWSKWTIDFIEPAQSPEDLLTHLLTLAHAAS
jgi:nitrile hydratase subunit beta